MSLFKGKLLKVKNTKNKFLSSILQFFLSFSTRQKYRAEISISMYGQGMGSGRDERVQFN